MKVTTRWVAIPCEDVLNHSRIVRYADWEGLSRPYTTTDLKTGPVPDELVDKVMDTMKETWKLVMSDAAKELLFGRE